MHDAHPVIYLTGAPATGKSTTASELRSRYQELRTFAWGEEARAHVSRRTGRDISLEEFRASPASLLTPEDVRVLDERLIVWTSECRKTAPVLIDTHAVTREVYGFRTTPFSDDQWKRLRVTHMFALYASPRVVQLRLEGDPAGRLASSVITQNRPLMIT